MKMTIEQYYEALKAKKQSAEQELEDLYIKYKKCEINADFFAHLRDNLVVTIKDYFDCICLLEASHLLDNETQELKGE